MATANASVSSKNARKKQVKKKTGLGPTSQKDELTGLGLTSKKDESFGEWYSEVIFNLEMIDSKVIPRLYTEKPWMVSILENMQTNFDEEIEKMGINVAYRPLFLTERVLQKEKYHIERFAPEIADRPRSETVVYPYFSEWISNHEDLPLKLNQWCNIIQWKHKPRYPFIRNPEFLWQEGHTAFATKEEADIEVLEILELYQRFYEEYLAIPVVKGWKSELEKIVGALYSTSVAAFIPNTGCGIHCAASHCLGQSFAQKFEIYFKNEKGKNDMVWQNFWTYSTVTIGLLAMVHGDDKGLVLPPKVADPQIIIIDAPCKDADVGAIFAACASAVCTLLHVGFRVEHDVRDYSLGWKYSCWEMKGVPLIIEIGPEDIAKNQVQIVRRDNGSKVDVPTANLVEHVLDLLLNIQESMFNVAKVKRDACKKIVYTWEDFMSALNEKKLILAPWCDEEEVEKDVWTRTKGELGPAKTLCSPFDHPSPPEGTLCFASGKPAKKWTYWSRSY